MPAFDLLTAIARWGEQVTADRLHVTLSTLKRWRRNGVPAGRRLEVEILLSQGHFGDEAEVRRLFHEVTAQHGKRFARLRCKGHAPELVATQQRIIMLGRLAINDFASLDTIAAIRQWSRTLKRRFEFWKFDISTTLFGEPERHLDEEIVGKSAPKKVESVEVEHGYSGDLTLHLWLFGWQFEAKNKALESVLDKLMNLMQAGVWVWIHCVESRNYHKRDEAEENKRRYFERKRMEGRRSIRDLVKRYGITTLANLMDKSSSTIRRWARDGAPSNINNDSLIDAFRELQREGMFRDFTLKARGIVWDVGAQRHQEEMALRQGIIDLYERNAISIEALEQFDWGRDYLRQRRRQAKKARRR